MDNGSGFWILFILIIVAAASWIGFNLLDAYIKKGNKKPSAPKNEKPEEKVPVPQVEVPPQSVPTQSVGFEAGPNLADELEKVLQQDQSEGSNDRMHTATHRHIRSLDRMQKYRETKHYENFKYDIDYNDEPEDDAATDNIKLTPSDYKKIVALGNINARRGGDLK